MKLGSLRHVDCVEAEVVLASGVYLTFRLDVGKKNLHSLVETGRYRLPRKYHRDAVPIDAYVLQKVRRGVFDAIIAHRETMHLPAPPIEQRVGRHVQLAFPLIK